MKRADLTAGMEVYYVPNSWLWSNGLDRPEDCRAVVVDDKRWAEGGFRQPPAEYSRGLLVHLKWRGEDIYVPLARVKGEYEAIATKRAADLKQAAAVRADREALVDADRRRRAEVLAKLKAAKLWAREDHGDELRRNVVISTEALAVLLKRAGLD